MRKYLPMQYTISPGWAKQFGGIARSTFQRGPRVCHIPLRRYDKAWLSRKFLLLGATIGLARARRNHRSQNTDSASCLGVWTSGGFCSGSEVRASPYFFTIFERSLNSSSSNSSRCPSCSFTFCSSNLKCEHERFEDGIPRR